MAVASQDDLALGHTLQASTRADDGRVTYTVSRWGQSRCFTSTHDMQAFLARIGRCISEFKKDQLPESIGYFESQGLTLSKRGKWRTTECRFHDGSDSMRINTTSGAWICMACNAKGVMCWPITWPLTALILSVLQKTWVHGKTMENHHAITALNPYPQGKP